MPEAARSRLPPCGLPPVTRTDLERELARLSSRVADPAAGLFGPGSPLWEVNRHTLLFAGSGRAALLQLAHPFVGEAIVGHSRTARDPYGRFQRTFRQVFAMVWADLDHALAAARRVHAVHSRINGRLSAAAGRHAVGDRYDAADPAALLWVHATLWDTSVRVFEALVRTLRSGEKERYYQETKRFASLFGIPRALLPPSWEDFERYNRAMWDSDQLGVGPAVAEIADFLLRPARPALAPLNAVHRILTTGLLPPRLRELFGLPFSTAERRRFERLLRRLRALLPLLPSPLRYLPHYQAANRRLAGRPGPGLVAALLMRLYVGKPASNGAGV